MTQWRLLTLLYVVTVTGLAHGTPPAHRKIQTVTPGTSKPGVRLSPPTSAAVPPLPLLQPPSTRPAPLPARASPPDVSVTCSTSDVVVRVRAAFYGFGADAAELRLGSSCTSTGVLRPYGDLLFAYPLTACDSRREVLRRPAGDTHVRTPDLLPSHVVCRSLPSVVRRGPAL